MNERLDPKYKKWRATVYRRDGFRCRMPNCGKRGKIHAHHIQRWADTPTLRYAVDNGVTLCKGCHALVTGNEGSYEALFMRLVAPVRNDILIELMLSRRRPTDGQAQAE